MSFSIDNFVRIRPYLYHLTAAPNAAAIARSCVLESATRILAAAGRMDMNRVRRRHSTIVHVKGRPIHIRDQAPLHFGNMLLEPGWALEDFVAHLNERVYFWPGDERGPIPHGLRHFSRYCNEPVTVLRASTAILLSANPMREPRFSRYNSGSPRFSRGRASPRTAQIFAGAAQCSFPASEVVEVTFDGRVTLPPGTQSSRAPSGPWANFLESERSWPSEPQESHSNTIID